MKIQKLNKKILTVALILVMTVSAFNIISLAVASESNVSNAKEQYDAFRYTKDVTEYPYTMQYYSKEAHAVTPSVGPLTNHTLWTKPIQRVTGSVVADGKLWLSYDTPIPTLKCLDAYSGETIWEKFSTSGVTSTAAPYLELSSNRVTTGFLYVIFDGALKCYQASDGVLYWEVPIGDFQSFIGEGTPMGADFAFVGPTSDKYIFLGDYFAGDPGDIMGAHVWAITKGRRGGDIAWATFVRDTTDYWTGGPAALADGILYAGEYITDAHLNAFNATTGELLWSTYVGGYDTYATTVVDGKVYTNTSPGFDVPGGAIIALDAQEGNILWMYNTTGIPMSNPIVYNDIVYQAVFLDNKLYGLDINNGNLVWSMDSAGGGRGTTLADGKIYGMAYGDTDLAGNFIQDGFFYCLDPDTKELIWKYQLTNTGAYSRGFAVADGIAYGGTLDGIFYAFGMGPTTTELSVTGTNLVTGETIAIGGKVFDESPASPGAPVVDVSVNILVQKMGESTWTTLDPATTDGMGRFLTQWTPTTEGAFTIVAKFDGTDSFGWSSKQAVVQVNSAPPTGGPIEPEPGITTEVFIIAVVAIIAIIGIGAYWFLRKRQ